MCYKIMPSCIRHPKSEIFSSLLESRLTPFLAAASGSASPIAKPYKKRNAGCGVRHSYLKAALVEGLINTGLYIEVGRLADPALRHLSATGVHRSPA